MSVHRSIVSVVCVDQYARRVTLQRTIDLPFPPSLTGPELGFAAADHDWSGEVVSVVYDVRAGVYHVELGEWLGPQMTLTEMIAAMGPEWKRLSEVV